MKTNSPKLIVLITGASSGIGLELVKILINDERYRVIATALESSLDLIANENIFPNDNLLIRSLDVSQFDQIQNLFDELESINWHVDILINNAGISYRTVVEEMDEADDHKLMEINYFGAVSLIRKCLPQMRKKQFGRIINISSVGGMMAMPTMGAYSATKWALEGLSESLWYELKPWGIKVSLVEPGFINSLAFKKVLLPKNQDVQKSDYFWYYHYMSSFIEKIMRLSPSTSQSVAKSIIKIMKAKRPRLRNPCTIDAYFFDQLRRITPRFIYHRVLYHALPGIKNWANKNPNL